MSRIGIIIISIRLGFNKLWISSPPLHSTQSHYYLIPMHPTVHVRHPYTYTCFPPPTGFCSSITMSRHRAIRNRAYSYDDGYDDDDYYDDDDEYYGEEEEELGEGTHASQAEQEATQ